MRMFAQFFGGGEDPFSSFFNGSGVGGPQIFFSSGGDDMHGFGGAFGSPAFRCSSFILLIAFGKQRAHLLLNRNHHFTSISMLNFCYNK